MRGEYITAVSYDGAEIRFIPTCVGNTNTVIVYSFIITVHPHMRGEYV